MHDIHHRAHFVATIATGIDHMLARNVAVCRVYSPLTTRRLRQAGYRRMAIHLGARQTGPARQCLAQLRRIDVTVHRIPQRAQQVVRGDQRMAFPAFVCIDYFEINVHPPGHGLKMPIAVEMILCRRQSEPAGAMMIVDRIVGIIGQFPVQLDGMGFQANHGLHRAEIGDLCCRMPGGTRCQFVALQQNDITPAFLRQVIQCGATGNATADNDYACM